MAMLLIVGGGLFTQLLTTVTGILSARMLGVEGRGQIVLVASLAMMTSQLTLGGSLPNAITHQLADRGVTARDGLRRLVPKWTWWSLLPAAIAGGYFLVVERDSSGNAKYALAVIVLIMAIQTMMSRILVGAMLGEGANLIHIAMTAVLPQAFVATVLGTAYAVGVHWNAVELSLVTMTCIFIVLFGRLRLLKKPTQRDEDALDGKTLYDLARRTHIGSVGPIDGLSLDRTLVGSLLGSVALGLYSVAFALAAVTTILGGCLAMVILPRVTLAQKDPGTERHLVRRWLLLSAVMIGSVVLVLELVAGWAIRVAFGEEFVAATACHPLAAGGCRVPRLPAGADRGAAGPKPRRPGLGHRTGADPGRDRGDRRRLDERQPGRGELCDDGCRHRGLPAARPRRSPVGARQQDPLRGCTLACCPRGQHMTTKGRNAVRQYGPGNPLVFSHIPKTAGTSLRVALERALQPAVFVQGVDTSLLAGYDDLDAISPAHRAALYLSPDELPADATLVAGHIGPATTMARYPGADHITVLRAPELRILSQWLHGRALTEFNLRHWGPVAEAFRVAWRPLGEFLDHAMLAPNVDNTIARFLAWPHPALSRTAFIDESDDEAVLAAALERLDTFGYVNLVENPAFQEELGAWLGRELPPTRANERTAVPKRRRPDMAVELDGATRELLAAPHPDRHPRVEIGGGAGAAGRRSGRGARHVAAEDDRPVPGDAGPARRAAHPALRGRPRLWGGHQAPPPPPLSRLRRGRRRRPAGAGGGCRAR